MFFFSCTVSYSRAMAYRSYHSSGCRNTSLKVSRISAVTVQGRSILPLLGHVPHIRTCKALVLPTQHRYRVCAKHGLPMETIPLPAVAVNNGTYVGPLNWSSEHLAHTAIFPDQFLVRYIVLVCNPIVHGNALCQANAPCASRRAWHFRHYSFLFRRLPSRSPFSPSILPLLTDTPFRRRPRRRPPRRSRQYGHSSRSRLCWHSQCQYHWRPSTI